MMNVTVQDCCCISVCKYHWPIKWPTELGRTYLLGITFIALYLWSTSTQRSKN
uniref:Uncharacterized protein n=1 Tax=Ciona intestinalis TaxID=7719 RepID=H2XLW6_CIOIN